jgi:predicted RNA-binding protein
MKAGIKWWLIAGPPENWEIAFKEGNIWGLRPVRNLVANWEKLSQGDRVLFYSTKPVSGVIGYGVARAKFKQDKPLWPQEIKEGKVIWPFRFEFDVEYCLPQDKWITKKVATSYIMAAARGAFQPIKAEMSEEVIKNLPLKPMKPVTERERPLSLHDDVKAKLVQIGRLQKLIAESEYPMDGAELDAVWRRVENAVPAYVFEVQIGGDIYHAIGKLKHAYDIWNSNLILVARNEDLPKIRQLLAGTFHEVNDKIKIVEPCRVEELFKLKKAYRDLEAQIGIL